MSLTFRNLVVLALLCGVVFSMSISKSAHRRMNQHGVRVIQSSSHSSHDQQFGADAGFADALQTNITTIVNSIQPQVPAIIETRNLPTFSYSRNTCEYIRADQKQNLLERIRTAKANVTSFKSGVEDQKVANHADNSLKWLTVVQQLLNKNCGEITKYLLIGPTPYQTNLLTTKPWIFAGIQPQDIVLDYTARIILNSNVTNCGTETPFWTGSKCVQCSEPLPIFIFETGLCGNCPAGTAYNYHADISIFDPHAHSCESAEPLEPSLKDLFNAIY